MRHHVLILTVFFSQFGFAQSYYPLATGNQWFYDSSSTPYNIRVEYDSLFSNGHHYAVLSRKDFVYGQYVRADSHYVYYFDPVKLTDVPIFNLQGKKGDTTFFSYFAAFDHVIITNIDSMAAFNKNTRIISYRLDGIQLREITLSDKFGPLRASLYSDPPPPWPDYVFNAVGCVVDGTRFGYTTSVNHSYNKPTQFNLRQNYPNPFNPTTTIYFSISERSYVELKIFDCLGRQVDQLVSEFLPAGLYNKQWVAENIAAGVYYYRLTVGQQSDIKKLILLR